MITQNNERMTQILELFTVSLKQLKGFRQQTVQTHVTAALCSVLKPLGSSRVDLGPEEVRRPAMGLLVGALESSNPLLQCMAAEGLSRLVQVVNNHAFPVSMTLLSFDNALDLRLILSLSHQVEDTPGCCDRTGHAQVLGALHRYVEGTSSPQHLSACVGILFTLSQDSTSPEVQRWALHSLSKGDGPGWSSVPRLCGGQLHPGAEAAALCPPTHVEVHQSLGRCLNALLTTLDLTYKPSTRDVTIKEVGLEGALLSLLERESDPRLCQDIQETLVHMMSSIAMGKLAH
ncbi:unnamed protein product [Coregonus sp. 'balchen']|nr:unnamed protein product [Coregonus sp. 'balchen']